MNFKSTVKFYLWNSDKVIEKEFEDEETALSYVREGKIHNDEPYIRIKLIAIDTWHGSRILL